VRQEYVIREMIVDERAITLRAVPLRVPRASEPPLELLEPERHRKRDEARNRDGPGPED